MANIQDWKTTDINVDSLWLIDKRNSTGKHENIYHGNFIPQIPNQLIRRYTKENDLVLELFSGSGTTLFECENLNRNYIGFDINSEINNIVNQKMQNTNIQYCLNCSDVTDESSFHTNLQNSLSYQKRKEVDFIIAHPPYKDIVKFTDFKEDLSSITDVDEFINKIVITFRNALVYLRKNKYFAVVMGDVYKKVR